VKCVGWVERSDTHLQSGRLHDGYRKGSTYPTRYAGRAQISGRTLAEVRAAAMAERSIKEMIDPKDIAALAVFLASDAAKSISGQVLPIDNDRQRA
jgi:NAD(P)-dependent dehydrogenase (short-subunit alcohol dehydrogenase family)